MSVKVALFANDYVGLEVCKCLVERGDRIVKLYVHDEDSQKFTDEIIAASKCNEEDIVLAKNVNDPQVVEALKEAAPDFIITVYWAYLLKPEIFGIAKNTLNFHPALLPINRGWYPHVHSILDGTPTGVTLHQIVEAADAGDVWVQKEVPLQSTETAYDIYTRLQEEIINLFRNNWDRIKNGEVTPSKQDESKSIYRPKKALDNLDFIDLDKEYHGKDLINLLRARTFGKRGFAYFVDENDERIYLNLKLSKTNDFNDA